MGSISYQIPFGSSAKKEVVKYARENYKGELLVSNFAPGDPGGSKYGWGGYYFGAHKLSDGQVYASVIAYAQRQGEVVIKAMDESMGPNACGVGSKVLAALTPLPEDAHEWQKGWREAAVNYQAKRKAALAAKGKLIKLAKPVNLNDGSSVQYVEVLSLNRWRKPYGGLIRCGSDWFLSDWEVVSEIAASA